MSDREIALVTLSKLESHLDEDARRFAELRTELRDGRDETIRHRTDQSRKIEAIYERFDDIEEKQAERHTQNLENAASQERALNRVIRQTTFTIIGALAIALATIAYNLLGKHP